MRSGDGKFIDANGDMKEGEWENDKLIRWIE